MQVFCLLEMLLKKVLIYGRDELSNARKDMFYIEVFKKLDEKKVRYLIIGGVAVNLYGFPRMTLDLDLMIDLKDEFNVGRFIESINELNFKPVISGVNVNDFAVTSKRDLWKKEKNMEVFSFYNPAREIERVDVMIENYIDFDEAYAKRKEFEVEGILIMLASIDDIIKLKKISNRKRDIIDIEALEKIKEIENEKKQRI